MKDLLKEMAKELGKEAVDKDNQGRPIYWVDFAGTPLYIARAVIDHKEYRMVTITTALANAAFNWEKGRFSLSMQEASNHIYDSIAWGGQPDILEISKDVNGARAYAVRKAHGVAGENPDGSRWFKRAGSGKEWDEYPFASTSQGGATASLRDINAGHNATAGIDYYMFRGLHWIWDGDEFHVKVITGNRGTPVIDSGY